jgi:UDP-N-acetylglucosamine transferase subunit ALG13
MILVMLGTQNNSFHRLLEEIEKLIKKQVIKEEVIVQAGYTKYKSKYMKIFDLISKEELDKLQDEADLIITHGGVGSIISAIEKEKRVIAVPRLHKYREHVNDHQKEIIEKYSKEQYIIGCMNVEELESAIDKVKKFEPKKFIKENKKILQIIEDFIENI